MGINTVVLIRAGLGKWIASPFQCLLGKEDVYYPPVDLVEMFLTLAINTTWLSILVCTIPGSTGRKDYFRKK